MTIPMFASVYIGTYEVTLKVFEFTEKRRLHQVDFLRSRVDLGREIFTSHKLGYESVESLCEILGEFQTIMTGYGVTEKKVYATSAFKHVENLLFVQDQIFLRTGLSAEVISNARHRFIGYKAVAVQPTFEKLIASSAAVVDVGGTSVQITLFEQGRLQNTHRLEIGMMRLRDTLYRPGVPEKKYQQQIAEYIEKKLTVYRSLYLEQEISNIIFISDYGLELARGLEKGKHKGNAPIRSEHFNKYMDKLLGKNLEEITSELNLADEKDPLILPSILLFRKLVESLGSSDVWFPGVDINDGFAWDFAQQKGLVSVSHNFEKDVISAARAEADHYHSFSPHIEALEKMAVQIFDATKRVHGMGKREKLLLRVSTILHDVGKYVSFSNDAACAWQIIRSSEIIGLTEAEREIVARTVLYNSTPLESYEDLSEVLSRSEYITVAKLSAILQVANALDQSHRQKFKSIRVSLKERELLITVEAYEDISLEQMLFEEKTRAFEDVFSMKPLLRAKRVTNFEKK